MSESARSVTRTIALFEEFARARRGLTSGEIIERLQAPRSSVTDLLRTLVGHGVLAIDRRRSVYLPTARFAMLGDWLAESWRSNHALLDALERLARDTGETTAFAAPIDLEMEIVFAVNRSGGLHWTADVGQRYTLFGSAAGAAHLASLPLATIRSMYARAQRLSADRGPKAPLNEVLALVRSVRAERMTFAIGGLHDDVAALAAAVPLEIGPRPLYVAIGGLKERFTARRALMQARLRQFLDEV